MKTKIFLLSVLTAFTLFSCSKKNDAGGINNQKEQQLAGKTWVGTTASTSNQQLALNSNKSFTMQLSTALPGYDLKVNISGNWAVEGDNIVMTNTQAFVYNNGEKITNLQSFLTANGCATCFQTVRAALNNYSLLLQVDDNGNLSIKDSDGNTMKFYIKELKDGNLVLTYGSLTLNFVVKTN